MKKFLAYFLALTLLLGNVSAAVAEETGMELPVEEIEILEVPELEVESEPEAEITALPELIIEEAPAEEPTEVPVEEQTEVAAEAPTEEPVAEAEATLAPVETEAAEESVPELTAEIEITEETELPELETEQEEETPEASEPALSVFLSATAVENGVAKIVAFIEKNFDGEVSYNWQTLDISALEDAYEIPEELWQSVGCNESTLTLSDLSEEACFSTLYRCVVSAGDLSAASAEIMLDVGQYAFAPMSETTSSDFEYTISDGACTITKYIGSATVVEIPETIEGAAVTVIGDYAFYGCANLTDVTIPRSVKIIGDYAFSACKRLSSVKILGFSTNIGAGAIPQSALVFCEPDSVASAWCIANGLVYVEAVMTDPTAADFEYTFSGSECTITKYIGSATVVEIPETIDGVPVTAIGKEAFLTCTKLKEVTIPGSVKSIGDYAFLGCGNLKKATIKSGVTSIGEAAFLQCNLVEITIPESVTHIGGNAFLNCKNLAEVTIFGSSTSSATSIGASAFAGCTRLTAVIIPGNGSSVGRTAFQKCTSLTKVIIGSGVTSIGGYAFSGCTSLTEVKILGSETSIGDDAVPQNAIIYCEPGSTAAAWCIANDRTYIELKATPTPEPTATPTPVPTATPTPEPTATPTPVPTATPTPKPTATPTPVPTATPTPKPTATPTPKPTATPTPKPTATPTPVPTATPTPKPTATPTPVPTATPTPKPTATPTPVPTATPTPVPTPTPTPIPVSGIKLNFSQLHLGKGQTVKTLKAVVSPENAADTSVKWSSSNTAVAKVDASTGAITCVANKGSATITATTANGLKASCTVTAQKRGATGISLTSSKTVVTGKYFTLKAKLSGKPTKSTVTWTSSDSSVATVTSKGKVTGKKPGTATITATSASGYQATCKVTVQNQLVTRVKLSKTKASLQNGKTLQLKATISPSNAYNKAVKWTSSDESVATVSASGLVTALKPGTAIIRCTAQDGSGKAASCKVTVKKTAVTKVQLTYNGKTTKKLAFYYENEKDKTNTGFAGKALPSNATVQGVTWKSSNSKVISIDASTGAFKVVGVGKATISCVAKDNAKRKASCTITVKKTPVKSVKVSYNGAAVSKTTLLQLKLGATDTGLSAQTLPATATIRGVTWKSSNAKTVKIDSATGAMTALKKGTVTITCTAKDNKKVKLSFKVRVS